MVPDAGVAASWGVPEAFCASRNVLCGLKQQLQRLGALPERSLALEAAVATFGHVAGAFCCLRCSSCSVQERCWSVLWPQTQKLQDWESCISVLWPQKQ